MLLDALFALLIIKFFELEGLHSLVAVACVCLIRTCHNVNCVIGTMNDEYLEKEEEEN